ncbi:MAG: hypothetical protein K2J71_01105 [Oscillospiraceae bacterium]|nr:hypothetical protein [Oscillospiraceae bacterium]
MKTVLINASPKKKMSVSAHFLALQRIFIQGEVIKETLRNKTDYDRLLQILPEADAVVFCLPLYVDGVPSHVLHFMKKLEQYCHEHPLRLNVYVISNGGFIEGNQNQALMQVFENFYVRSHLNWCGGIGIGGGVMLNVMRILFFVYAGMFVLNLINGALLQDALLVLAKQWGIVLFFHAGVLFYQIRMGIAVNRGTFFGVKYTRAMMPSFLFILVADLFFLLISVFQGGLFRGWLRKK